MDTATTNTEVPTTIGAPFAGGYYAGRIRVGELTYAVIAAPKEQGEHEDTPLGATKKSVDGALSFFDGAANTDALAEAGSKVAQWAQGLAIAGFTDWYIPSRDELEILYRAFKPTAGENYCWRGDNPSSVPVGYAYGPKVPTQTVIAAFHEDGPEAFDTAWYWSSTQFAGGESYAWMQTFDGGNQYNGHKSSVYRVRAVRRVLI